MSGKILIVDELSSNRIVLRVKLSTAHYEVVQAESAAEALRSAAALHPDLILANVNISNMNVTAFVAALRRIDGMAETPVVLLQGDCTAAERLDLLRAGADAVLSGHIPELLLLARLRNLLRQHHADQDLCAQAGAVQPAGFAEIRQDFAHAGRIAVIAPSASQALALRAMLVQGDARHVITAVGMDQIAPTSASEPVPDVCLLRFGPASAEAGLRLLADLKAAQRTRTTPVVAFLDGGSDGLAVTLFDIGADDVITGPCDPAELSLRIARQIQRKRRSERLRAQLLSGLRAAVVDPLTGLYNRRHALPFLQRQIERSRDGSNSFAVMVADLDFFKQVNDIHGHAAGDIVLCAVGERLRAGLGEGDMLARIGGEEFLIITAAASRDAARRTADHLCRMIRQTPIMLPGRPCGVTVTVSIGITMPQNRPGLPVPTVDGLLQEADRALYVAKAQGRNKASFCVRSAA